MPGHDFLPTVAWRSGAAWIIDQTLLPAVFRRVAIRTPEAMRAAIRRLAVRGAPAIGCAAAYGAALGLGRPSPARGRAEPGVRVLLGRVLRAADLLAASRPTAVNLSWACGRMASAARRLAGEGVPPGAFRRGVLAEARAIHAEDLAMGARLARAGLPLVRARRGAAGRAVGVLTHCNAGRLASSGHGLALAPVYAAHAAGRPVEVWAGETRPLCQGSRLTAWELARAGVKVTVLCDGMAAQAMRAGSVDLVMVGADRVAANGDVANKVGTYGLAVLARHHGIPFYVVAPSSTLDPSCPDGAAIPIERRDGGEIRGFFGRVTVAAGAAVDNPAFDVTPAGLVTALVTDRGVVRRPDRAKMARLAGRRFPVDAPAPAPTI